MRAHTESFRVPFCDTDLSGRIHYTTALRYFEIAENYLQAWPPFCRRDV